MPKTTTYIEAGSGDMRDAANYDNGLPVDGDTLIMTDPVPTIALDSPVTLAAYDGSGLTIGFPFISGGWDPSSMLIIASGGTWSTAAGYWSGDASQAASGLLSGGGGAYGAIGNHCYCSGNVETVGGAGDGCTWDNALNSSAAGDHAQFLNGGINNPLSGFVASDGFSRSGSVGDFATFDAASNNSTAENHAAFRNGALMIGGNLGDTPTFGDDCQLLAGACAGPSVHWTGAGASLIADTAPGSGLLDLSAATVYLDDAASVQLINNGSFISPAALVITSPQASCVISNLSCPCSAPITLPSDADVRAGTTFAYNDSHTGTLAAADDVMLAIKAQTDRLTFDAHDFIFATPAGPGADLTPLQITDGATGLPDASVWITSDAPGLTTIAGATLTDASGNVSFLLTRGTTVYLWMAKPGYQPILGTPFTVP